jgi:hypothetical protein
MIGTTRFRVSFFMNKFRSKGLVSYNGKIEMRSSLLDAVLHDKPSNARRRIDGKLHRREEMMVMDYCGVEFITVESAEGSSWKWRLSILDKDKMKTSGEAASRAEAISQAHEAIGEGLRANASPDQDAQLPWLVGDVLHILHGARSLPSVEAVEALRPFVNTMRNRASGNDRLADASAAAVGALVRRLEAKGVATDDLWEEAIEASLSFANEVAPPSAEQA